MEDKIKLSIIDGAKFSLEQVQYTVSLDEDKPLEVWQDEVQKFLNYWDKVFLYGLKSVRKGYWSFVSKISHPTLVNEVKDTPGAVNDLMRSRVWLSTILNDNELENYLQIITYETKLLAKFYRPNAIVRDASLMDDLISIACGQEITLFSIHMDDICQRCDEIFVGPDNYSSYNKLFDVRFNWDESIRTRSSSVYSIRSTRSYAENISYHDRGSPARPSYGNKSMFLRHPGDDIGVNAEYLERMVTPSPSPSPRTSLVCKTIEEDADKETEQTIQPTVQQYQAVKNQEELHTKPHLQDNPIIKKTEKDTHQDDKVLSHHHTPETESQLQSTNPFLHHHTPETESQLQSTNPFSVELSSDYDDTYCERSQDVSNLSIEAESHKLVTSYGTPTQPHDSPTQSHDSPTQSHDSLTQSDTLRTGLNEKGTPGRDNPLTSSPKLSSLPKTNLQDIVRENSSPAPSSTPSTRNSRVSSISSTVSRDTKDTVPILKNKPQITSNESSITSANSIALNESIISSSPGATSLKRKKKVARIESVQCVTSNTSAPSREEVKSTVKDDLSELLDIRTYETDDLVDIMAGVEVDEEEHPSERTPSELQHEHQSSSLPDSEPSHTSDRDITEPHLEQAPTLQETALRQHKVLCKVDTQPYSDEEVTNDNVIPIEEMMRPPSPKPDYESIAGSSYSSLSDKSRIIESDVEFLEDKPQDPFVLFNQLGAEGLINTDTFPKKEQPNDLSDEDPYDAESDHDFVETVNSGNVLECRTSPVRSSNIPSDNVNEIDKSIEQELSHASLDLQCEDDEREDEFDEISDTSLPRSSSVIFEIRSRSNQRASNLDRETDHNIPAFGLVTIDRDQAVVVPTDNQKITWSLELFNEQLNEEYRVMYRIWMKDEVGNLEVCYLLLTNITVFLLDFEYTVNMRIPLKDVSYGRGLNWQVITLFYVVKDGTTDQVDLITGCEAISRGIMEGFAVHTEHPVIWSMDESYSQQRLKYHVGAFVQKQQSFSMASIDNLHYSIVSWDPLKGDSIPATNYPMTQGVLGLKEPTMFSYVWKDYYFILDNGKLSQFDTECSGIIKKEYTIIGSSSCRKMKRDETSKNFAFKFISEEGDEVMLNCKNEQSRDRWMNSICETAMEIPHQLTKTDTGLQCSVVVNEDFVIIIREGLKTAFTLSATQINEITSISWYPDEEFCIISVYEAKRVWLLLFRDIYETNKFMELVWDKWSEMYQINDAGLLFKRLSEDIPAPAYIPGCYDDQSGPPIKSESMLTKAKRSVQEYRDSSYRHSQLSF